MRNRLHFLLFAALLAAPVVAQESKLPERVDVNAVLVDAVVTDAKGQQILGLDKDDFIVKENGVPQTIDSIDYFTNRRVLNAPENQTAFKAEHIRSDRWFILFFDKPNDNLLYDQLIRARNAARKFVDEQMLPGDHLAIVGHDVRLKIYSDFSTDKRHLDAALDDSVRFSLGIKKAPANAGEGSLFQTMSTHQLIDKTGTVYEALEVLADATRGIHARKTLVLFSPGILERGQEIIGGIPTESRYYKPMIESLNAANVTVNAVNLQSEASAINPLVHRTLEAITADTQGEYFRSVSFEMPLKKVEQQSNGYYLLTYRSTKSHSESGYQKVDVTLRNPEFRIKARDGYRYGD
jgi:VWFA-related protein